MFYFKKVIFKCNIDLKIEFLIVLFIIEEMIIIVYYLFFIINKEDNVKLESKFNLI